MTLAPGTNEDPRVARVFVEYLRNIQELTDRVFAWLFIGQWVFAVLCAIFISPLTWNGMEDSIHIHVWAASFLGGTLISLPIALILWIPGSLLTRIVVASTQVMFSGLIIHLMGGRIEAHFHIFGSLAILSFYRDPRVFVPAVGLVVLDHWLRGMFWPESVFGIAQAASWRSLEHGAWLLFETAFLLWGIAQSRSHLWTLSAFQVSLFDERDLLERRVEERVKELKEQRSFLRSLVDHLPCAVFWKSRDLRYVGGNEAFAKLAGFKSTEDIVDDHLETLWSPDKVAEFRQAQLKVLASGQDRLNDEVEVLMTNGRSVDLLSSNVPLRNEAGEIAGLIGILQDISELKTLQSQLAEVQQFVSMRQVAGTIANEIYAPLQQVTTNIAFLKNCNDLLFAVVYGYRDSLFDKEMKSHAARMEDMRQLLADARFDEIHEQTPTVLSEIATAIEQVFELVSAMKGLPPPRAPEPVGTKHELS